MRFHLSNEFYCIKSATKRHENMMPTQVYFTNNSLRDEQQNVATNSHSVKYETLRFGRQPLVFLLYNFINKVHANIDTELCMRLNFFDL